MNNNALHLEHSAKWAGWSYLICMVTSIVGGLLVDTSLSQADLQSQWTLSLATGLEALNALGVLTIALVFYHHLKMSYPLFSLSYLVLRIIEASLCLVVAFIPLYIALLPMDSISNPLDLIQSALSIRSLYWDYLYPILFVASGLQFYSLLLQSRLVPSYIALWGLLALVGVAGAMAIPDLKMIPGLFIITNEIYLGIYLIKKGQRKKPHLSEALSGN